MSPRIRPSIVPEVFIAEVRASARAVFFKQLYNQSII